MTVHEDFKLGDRVRVNLSPDEDARGGEYGTVVGTSTWPYPYVDVEHDDGEVNPFDPSELLVVEQARED